jgi:NIPSNAP
VHQEIVELRQYTLKPGRRDELIELFDSALVEPQEDDGMSVIGQFRDLDRPDRFVWLRGFPGMDERKASLETFYTGPVWKAHSAAANATMLETDDVLLLRPAAPESAFKLDGATRGAEPAGDGPGFVAVTILDLDGSDPQDLFDRAVAPWVAGNGGSILGRLVTEPSLNTVPALPVREGENVLVCVAGFADPPAFEGAPGKLLRLVPTSRSRLHGRSPATDAT